MTVDSALVYTLLRDDAGQDLIEYALLAGLIGTVGALAWQAIGAGISAGYINWNTQTEALWDPPLPSGS